MLRITIEADAAITLQVGSKSWPEIGHVLGTQNKRGRARSEGGSSGRRELQNSSYLPDGCNKVRKFSRRSSPNWRPSTAIPRSRSVTKDCSDSRNASDDSGEHQQRGLSVRTGGATARQRRHGAPACLSASERRGRVEIFFAERHERLGEQKDPQSPPVPGSRAG